MGSHKKNLGTRGAPAHPQLTMGHTQGTWGLWILKNSLEYPHPTLILLF